MEMIGKGLERDATVLLHIALDLSCKHFVTVVHRRMTNRASVLGKSPTRLRWYVPRQCILATFLIDGGYSLKHLRPD